MIRGVVCLGVGFVCDLVWMWGVCVLRFERTFKIVCGCSEWALWVVCWFAVEWVGVVVVCIRWF